MKIRGHTVDQPLNRGQPYWRIRNADGVTVGSISIRGYSNNTPFCGNQSSGHRVQARGPVYFEVERRLLDEGRTDSLSISSEASMAALKAGHEMDWGHGGPGSGTVASNLSKGRVLAREKAWPWIKAILEKE